MTVENTVYFTGWQNANGSNKNWAYAFRIPSDDSVLILVRDTSNPAVITEYRSDFTRIEVDDNNGTIVFPVSAAALGATKQVRIVRDVPYTQMTQIGMEGAFNPEIHEDALDKLTMLAQQLYGAAERSLRFPLGDTVTELPSVRAGKVLAFDDDGNPIAGLTLGEISNAASYATAAITQAGIATGKAAEAAASAAAAATWDPANYSTTAQIQSSFLRYDTPQGLSAAQKQGLWAAIGSMPRLSSGAALPNTDIGPIWHDDYASIMTWQAFTANGASYTGYASAGIGRPSFDAQSSPRSGYLKRNGANVSKTAYAALWNWAQHSGRTLAIGSWVAGHDVFGDVNATTFRLPDVRGEFGRFWDDGRGVDSGRVFGSLQLDQMQQITGSIETAIHASVAEAMIVSGSGALSVNGAKGASYGTAFAGPNIQNDGISFNSANSPGARAGTETRPRSVAYLVDIKF